MKVDAPVYGAMIYDLDSTNGCTCALISGEVCRDDPATPAGPSPDVMPPSVSTLSPDLCKMKSLSIAL